VPPLLAKWGPSEQDDVNVAAPGDRQAAAL